jgi:hypothetical protein
LGYLCCLWHIPLYLFDLVDARLYPLAVLLGVKPLYEIIVQVYVFPLVGSGHKLMTESRWLLEPRRVGVSGVLAIDMSLERIHSATSAASPL